MLAYLLAVFLVLLTIYWYITTPRNLPPGPPKLPLIGNLLQLIKNRNRRGEFFNELGRKYGPVTCLHIGFNYLVVLNGADAVKEAFQHQGNAFAGRSLQTLSLYHTHGKGIVSVEGPAWKVNRRFILTTLRDLGMGRLFFEEHINAAVHDFCSKLAATRRTPFHITHPLGSSVLSNNVKILFNTQLPSENDEMILRQLDFFNTVSPSVLLANSNSFFIYLCGLPFFRKILGMDEVVRARQPVEDLVRQAVQKRKKDIPLEGEGDSQPGDFLSAYIAEQKRHENSEDAFWWDDEQLVHSCAELLLAGTHSTKLAITWALLFLSMNPEVQDKMFAEIESTLGVERVPSIKNQPEMPVSDAVVQEVLRAASVAPTSIPHRTLEDATLNGFHIPENASVMANLYGISTDPNLWAKPKDFDPLQHFYSPETNSVTNRDKLIPFSIGRRACIGEALARMELFLYLVGIVQRFTVALPSNVTPTTEAHESILRSPPIETFVFTPRDLAEE